MITDNKQATNGVPQVTRNRVQLTKPVQTYNNGRAMSMTNPQAVRSNFTPQQQNNFNDNMKAFRAQTIGPKPVSSLDKPRMEAVQQRYQQNQQAYPNRIALDNLLNAFAQVDESDAMEFMNMVATGRVLPKQTQGQMQAEQDYLSSNQPAPQTPTPQPAPQTPTTIPEEDIIGAATAPIDPVTGQPDYSYDAVFGDFYSK